ncbi:cation-translocating P-type ATPase [Methylobacillus flagellatus]|uniref:ATPase, E1-E2 type n=1 Tax=Methylobacillus flagellatus (strain ATCC 51484 / DSM 6875 / VKM B-1610 / KT) TaxID=265072 RepID=Q1GXW3_METFK|nr:cation-transporting P-type ATPase [Methylobacillus flagellatus]ABE50924.1 ATPase, E1-E2 type [Methylobacillus flagellatus KT]
MPPSSQQDAVAPPPWYALQPDEVLERVQSSPEGLTSTEAARRLQAHGRNELPAPRRQHPVMRFLSQFNNALIYFMVSAAVIAFFLDHAVDSAVIFAVVLINAIVGYIQEGKAEQALEAIRNMMVPQVTVLRDGHRRHLEVGELVPGDVIVLEAGDSVPADARLLRARQLSCEEAILTGESVPSQKQEQAVAEDADLGDRHCMLYSGTIVAAGQGRAVVVETGSATEIGRISSMISKVETLETPLLQQINHFGRLFTWFALSLALGLLAFARLVHDYDWIDAFMVVVAISVGLVPEGLPAVITITLAIGVQRMARRNAIIRRLPAVETLGATSVICSDKTGTLTRNEMTVRRMVAGKAHYLVEGTGYVPEGEIKPQDDAPDQGWEDLVRAGLLCNDAKLEAQSGQWHTLGDPMEGALVALAMKAGKDVAQERDAWRRLDEIPFDSKHKFMATLHHHEGHGTWIFVKGAPESVLEKCGYPDHEYWMERISEAAQQGERVLGFAAKRCEDGKQHLEFNDVGDGLEFLGIMGFIDPPREEVLDAIASCRSAGVKVKMITGDHAATAQAIAKQLHLADEPGVMTGAELDKVPDEELSAVLANTSVFARTTPEHKLRIVKALQQQGEVVAMTGDGVNDAPSLKQADVGIAMGRKGTEAAKQASEMVLADDNFATIVAAVHAGRTVYDNVRKVIAWTLPTNGGEALAVVIALLLGMALPMTPAQILWINMVLTVTLGLVLAFEPAEPDVMERPPRPRNAALLSPFLLWRVGFVSVLFTIGVFVIFEYAMQRELGEEVARTMVVNTLVVLEIFYLFNVRYLNAKSFSWRGLVGTPILLVALAVVIVAQLAFTYTAPLHALFASAPIDWRDGLVIILIGIVFMLVLEFEKMLMRKRGKTNVLAES